MCVIANRDGASRGQGSYLKAGQRASPTYALHACVGGDPTRTAHEDLLQKASRTRQAQDGGGGRSDAEALACDLWLVQTRTEF